MSNHTTTGSRAGQQTTGASRSNEKIKMTEARTRKIGLSDPSRAKEFFSFREKFTLGPTELNQIRQNQPDIINIIDVRQPEDYTKGHLPGAINLPREQWQSLAGLKKDKVNVIYCYTLECPLATKAAMEFASKGYSVMELLGGFEGWKGKNLRTETEVHH